MFIVADSGSTKVSWRIAGDGGDVIPVSTPGINPVFAGDDTIVRILKESIFPEAIVCSSKTVRSSAYVRRRLSSFCNRRASKEGLQEAKKSRKNNIMLFFFISACKITDIC